MMSSYLNSAISDISFLFILFVKSSFSIGNSKLDSESAKSDNADICSCLIFSASLIEVWRYAAISFVTDFEPNGITLE